jgi:phage tail-like protein
VRQPFTNLRFRVAIEGMSSTGAVEVLFPTARIVVPRRKRRAVHLDPLVIRRGLTLSTEWYDWWNEARRSARAPMRDVQVILLDSSGADALRWVYSDAFPLSYSLSPLNALAGEALIESLELQAGDFGAYRAE